ncbi:MAG: heme-binding protein, partial [Actinomycetes bacterium]
MSATKSRRVLDTAGVDAVMAAAEKAALTAGSRVVIVVVDASGRVLALSRTPDAQAASD